MVKYYQECPQSILVDSYAGRVWTRSLDLVRLWVMNHSMHAYIVCVDANDARCVMQDGTSAATISPRAQHVR